MRIRTVVIDDESKARDILIKLLQVVAPEIEVVDQAASAAAGWEAIQREKPDLVFLDVEMPQGSGFDLLERFAEAPFKVIFTTAYGHYAIKAIRFAAMDYLLKPIDADELRTAIDTVKGQLSGNTVENESIRSLIHNLRSPAAKKVAIPDMEGITFVQLQEIIRCEADRNYTVVYLDCGTKIVSSKALKEYERLFTDFNFMRLHHSHLINLNHVKRYQKGDGGLVVMSDDSTVDVSRRRKAVFLEKLASM